MHFFSMLFIFGITLLLKQTGQYWLQYLRYWQWSKRLNIVKHLQILQQISSPFNGFELSRKAREHSDAMEYVYGEIEPLSFIALLSLVHPHSKTVYYDLGSGIGKTVLLCAMVFNVKKACGIELFSALHLTAEQQGKQLNSLTDYAQTQNKIEFIQGNFLEFDYSNATLIFISATALIGTTWEQLNTLLESLQQKPIIITTTKKLNAAHFKLLRQTRVQMSWGVVNAYIQQSL